MIPIKKIAGKVERFVVYRILHVDDTPHRLALGMALGVFLAWTPTIGLQMILVLLLATALRANARVGLPVVWISNPLTLVPIYLPNYWLGRHLLHLFTDRPEPDYARLKELLALSASPGEMFSQFSQYWGQIFKLLLSISVDLWLGSVIMGLVLGGITYIVCYRLIVWYRTHTPRGRRFSLHMLRRKKKEL